eukprot:1756690-Pyramimonas_sp.AAC.1
MSEPPFHACPLEDGALPARELTSEPSFHARLLEDCARSARLLTSRPIIPRAPARGSCPPCVPRRCSQALLPSAPGFPEQRTLVKTCGFASRASKTT